MIHQIKWPSDITRKFLTNKSTTFGRYNDTFLTMDNNEFPQIGMTLDDDECYLLAIIFNEIFIAYLSNNPTRMLVMRNINMKIHNLL